MSDSYLIDATGTFCPAPIIAVGKAAAACASGALMELRATDPGTEADLSAWCRATGHRLESKAWVGNEFVALIRRK